SWSSRGNIARAVSTTYRLTIRSTAARTSITRPCRLPTEGRGPGPIPTTPNTEEFLMALIAPEPPKQAADAVHSTFLELNKNRAFRSPALRNATGPLQLTEPHQVFTLGLTDLAAGKGLDAAKPTGWR